MEGRDIWAQNKEFLPTISRVEYYNDEDQRNSVDEISKALAEELNITGAAEAYNKLRQGAYKADLWRLMVLWWKGGVYMDTDLLLWAPLEAWIDFTKTNVYLIQDCIKGDTALQPPAHKGLAVPVAYWQAMLASPARDPILAHIISSVIQNVHQHNAEEPVAPSLVSALTSYEGSDLHRIDQGAEMSSPDCRRESHGGTQFVAIPISSSPGKHKIMAIHQPMLTEAYAAVSADYGALHDSHLVYCDEGGVPCDRNSNRRLEEKLHNRRLDGHMKALMALMALMAPTTTTTAPAAAVTVEAP